MPLSTFVRRSLSWIPHYSHFDYSQFKCSTYISTAPSFTPCNHLSLHPSQYFNASVSVKSVCSLSSQKIKNRCWNCDVAPESALAPSFTPYNHLSIHPSQYFNASVSVKSVCSVSSQKIKNRCWNCNAEPESAPFLVCQSCRSIQPVDKSIDYFDIFGLEKNYDIEISTLEGKYKNWQKKLHPDLVHSKSEKERDFAAEQSAKVIDAYRTLTRPLSRAIYLLKLEGIEVDEEQTVSDPELLAEIMEIREAVEEASDSEALNHILSETQGKLKHWSNVFANAFQRRNFEEAKVSIQRMTYYERVTEEAAKKL